jgi:amino acid permease
VRYIKIAGLLVALFIVVGVIQLVLDIAREILVPFVPSVVASLAGWAIGIASAGRAWREGLGRWVRE